ncbi:MAG TPA: class I SAM-dependent methyltransferase [Stellaceae bacterium]|jgi:DNA phosphorothioation-associated putative methyltransferase|nr:class I SAM-dependent methyltransferase [Stellaceae bacterium]
MMSAVVARHLTALVRGDLSRPFRTALSDGLLPAAKSVMDYGCGRGDDVRFLEERGYECAGWDPVHAPNGARREADIVNLGYVVNVIEDPSERRDVLRRAWSLARHVLIVSARLRTEIQGLAAAPYADGLLTRLHTFQKFFDQQELRSWVDDVLETSSVAAAPGIFYVFRDAMERSSFAASRFRRATAAPRLRAGERLFAEHKPLLERLAAFVSERGRVPATEELPEYVAIKAALGSIARAFRVLEKVSEPNAWEAVRASRSQDLLAFVALSRFDGRPKFNELPRAMQLDAKSFFGSYVAACAAADELLFSLGHPERLEEAYRAAPIGKLMPTALYVHANAVAELPILLRLYEGCARRYLGSVPGANIVKLGRHERKISYLSYPQFEDDPHPALTVSVSVDLQNFRVRQRQYAEDRNPPVLHRKEEFLGIDHPARSKFARLTRIEEAKGLYDDPASIGTRAGWSRMLARKGLAFRGHRLVSAGPRDAVRGDLCDSTRAFYEERASEYATSTRIGWMEPVLSAFVDILPVGARVIDLGCGAGRDLALFRKRGLQAIGIDYSRSLVLMACEHSGAPVIVGDMRRLPFSQEVFDGAWAAASFLHLRRDEVKGALDEARRVIRPHGLFFTSLKAGSGGELDRHGRWFSYFEAAEWISRLGDSGFEVLDRGSDYERRRSNLASEDISWINFTARRM